MLSKEQLEKIANQGPVDIGGAQNPIVTEMATELLSLREQLAELKEWATNRAITDDARENENYTTLKIDYRQRQLRELLKTAKPAED
ncbi:TPA: hypothetical protein ACGE8L_003907 [Yersinia enterocolitica]|uniref:hypothetical protein n=1 Tax=Yersinia enterocolitica TaxID=630 RepID=UPI00285936BF|nr:hypothetical protein [Yersinia enterocolitica]EKN6093826.1 hypothetical protein [Yersinia enterocolitica]EKN6281238.1 hypothetical protein [Yersinia enterocolitica]ELY5242751.1 hypothetical protein [Yersinia enterocolitica]HDL6730877.1 hypothetical protein [Yersinia enterocolitica]